MVEDTGGNVTYAIPYCECGLTGGCDRCQPSGCRDNIFSELDEDRFMDEGLKEFYRKRGYL